MCASPKSLLTLERDLLSGWWSGISLLYIIVCHGLDSGHMRLDGCMQKTPVGEVKDTKVNGMLHAELCWRAMGIHRTAKVQQYCTRTARGGAKKR